MYRKLYKSLKFSKSKIFFFIIWVVLHFWKEEYKWNFVLTYNNSYQQGISIGVTQYRSLNNSNQSLERSDS